MTAARATVRTVAGEPLPAAAVATVNGTTSTYIGWDGLLFIESVATDNRLEVALPDGGTCHAVFTADAKADDIIELGDLTCRP